MCEGEDTRPLAIHLRTHRVDEGFKVSTDVVFGELGLNGKVGGQFLQRTGTMWF